MSETWNLGMVDLETYAMRRRWLARWPHPYRPLGADLDDEDRCTHNYDTSEMHSPAAYCGMTARQHEPEPIARDWGDVANGPAPGAASDYGPSEVERVTRVWMQHEDALDRWRRQSRFARVSTSDEVETRAHQRKNP